jgi:hypothetical protein
MRSSFVAPKQGNHFVLDGGISDFLWIGIMLTCYNSFSTKKWVCHAPEIGTTAPFMAILGWMSECPELGHDFRGQLSLAPWLQKRGGVSHFKASNQPMASDGNLRNRCKFAQHGLPVPVPIIMTHKTTLCPQHRATQNPVFHHLPDPIIVYIFLENPQDKPILCECLIVKWCENFPSYSETSPSLSEHYHFTLW